MNDKPEKIKLRIKGMHCASCALSVEKSLKKTRGVLNAVVNLGDNTASLEVDSSVFDPGSAEEAVKRTGYGVEYPKVSISIGNMSCVMCARKITESLKRIEGIREVSVDLSLGKADIEYDDKTVSLSVIRETIEKLGYTYGGIFEHDKARDTQDKVKKNSLIRRLLGL